MSLTFADSNITMPLIGEISNKLSIGTGGEYIIAMILATVFIVVIGQLKIRISKLIAFPVSVTLIALGMHLPMYWMIATAIISASTIISLEAITDTMSSGYWAIRGQREKAKYKMKDAYDAEIKKMEQTMHDESIIDKYNRYTGKMLKYRKHIPK